MEKVEKRVLDAISLAVQWHKRTARKNAIQGHFVPYIVHPMEVMKSCYTIGAGHPDILCAAVCHDLLEDTDVPWPKLLKVVGPEAGQIVQELTFNEKKMSQETYIKTFATASVPALVIKAMDRIANVKDFSLTDIGYAKKYYEKGAEIFEYAQARGGELDAYFETESVRLKLEDIVADLVNHVFFWNA